MGITLQDVFGFTSIIIGHLSYCKSVGRFLVGKIFPERAFPKMLEFFP
jgi:hypothetical protein